MIELNQPVVVAQKQFFECPTIVIDGDPEKGNRKINVTCRVLNENGELVNTYTEIFEGEDYNSTYGGFGSDKDLMAEFKKRIGVPLDLTQMPENWENTSDITPTL